ncbi:unnamed protein product [Meloidogyne enterolobii]|uniref:Uncharacterized protein n=1 Tax=Meloidogyne enterolobii TaxID=390850 RepID=A0ACB1AT87_MELEN
MFLLPLFVLNIFCLVVSANCKFMLSKISLKILKLLLFCLRISSQKMRLVPLLI